MDLDARVEQVRAAYVAVHLPLWRAVLAYSGSVEVADEAVAEAFAQLLRRGDGVDDPSAWVWRSAFRIAAGELKRRSSAAMTGGVPDVGVWLPEPALDLMAALHHLSVQQRACVVLCDLAGHGAPEAARLLGTTAATVRVQRMRARRRLRDLLEDHDA
ncbi:MAG: sigma factor-like helix-turn-helix DNA-binding protein [Acidimicrobiales bacterium]